MTTQTLMPGARVRWRSQAAGSWKTKEGVVVAVVEAGQHPSQVLAANDYIDGWVDAGCLSRKERSYLVRVGKRRQLYWPRVSALEVVEEKA